MCFSFLEFELNHFVPRRLVITTFDFDRKFTVTTLSDRKRLSNLEALQDRGIYPPESAKKNVQDISTGHEPDE